MAVATLSAAVHHLVSLARELFYDLALLSQDCLRCGASHLTMVGEGRYRCVSCGQGGDPTAAFQRCPSCGGRPRLRFRRYYCERCGIAIDSRFLFDATLYNPDYFRRKMAESRQRQRQERRDRRGWRPPPSARMPLGPIDLAAAPGLAREVDALIRPLSKPDRPPPDVFDLHQYKSRVLRRLAPDDRQTVHCLAGHPDTATRRREVARTFVACIYLWSENRLHMSRAGDDLWVSAA